jgi:four helix bundle protein
VKSAPANAVGTENLVERWPQDIRSRSFDYALRAIKLYQHLQAGKDGAGWVLGKQYLRSASSIGANIEEAQASESRADFVHKLGIAQKEARESLYWLRLLSESGIVRKGRMGQLMKETEEPVSIVTAIVVKCKRSASNE